MLCTNQFGNGYEDHWINQWWSRATERYLYCTDQFNEKATVLVNAHKHAGDEAKKATERWGSGSRPEKAGRPQTGPQRGWGLAHVLGDGSTGRNVQKANNTSAFWLPRGGTHGACLPHKKESLWQVGNAQWQGADRRILPALSTSRPLTMDDIHAPFLSPCLARKAHKKAKVTWGHP